MARFWSETMARYAFSASFLVLTLALASMVALALGAFPLTGSVSAVLAVQEALHSGLVNPLGRPVAVGLVLFAGLWPTFLVFGHARLARETTGSGSGVPQQGRALDDMAEPSASKALERIARRHRVNEADDAEPAGAEQDVDPVSEPEPELELEPELEPEPEPEPEPVDSEVLPAPAQEDPFVEPDTVVSSETDVPDEDFTDLASDNLIEPADPDFDPGVEGNETCALTDNHDDPLVPFEDVAPDHEPDIIAGPEIDSDDRPDGDALPETSFEPFPADDVMPNTGLPDEYDPGSDYPSHLPTLPVAGAETDQGPIEKRAYASLTRALPVGDEDDEDEGEDEDEGYGEEVDEEDEAEEFVRPDWLDDLERQAIVMRRQVPPPANPGLSFYGGVPIVPADFEWPVANVKGREMPLHFVMQVDLSAISHDARRQMLPENGILYFFLDLELGLATGYRVIHAEGYETSWREAEVPETLSPVYGEQARYSWPWIDCENADESGLPRLLPLWFMEPVAATLPEPPPVERDEDKRPRWWPICDSVEDELARVQGEEVWPEESSPVGSDGALLRPFSNFPHDWRAVAVASVQVLEELSKPSFAEACRRRELGDEATRKMRVQWSEEARECLAWANSHKPFDPVCTEESDMFWDWFKKLEGVNCLVLGRAAVHSIEATLSASPDADGVFDEDALKLVRARHALAIHTEEGLVVPTPHRMLAPPSYVQGRLEDVADKEVLLLELGAEEGIGLLFGEGVYQFTIAPDDLKAGRFERTKLTVSSC